MKKLKTLKVKFNPPFEKGAKKCRERALSRKDYDPVTLFRWGQMMATSLIETLKAVEAEFGQKGQDVVVEAIRKVGLMVGREMVEGVEIPPDATPIEVVSSLASCINIEAYASPEAPEIKSESSAAFDILWCPHEDYYGAFDCRVQRYMVQGMIDAFREKHAGRDFQVKVAATIPSGSKTCRFELWEKKPNEEDDWSAYSDHLAKKALKHAKK